jgi:hypothetical protein
MWGLKWFTKRSTSPVGKEWRTKDTKTRAIARQRGVTESAVRYHLRRRASGATDGRGRKVLAAAALSEVIDAWCEATSDGERPANVRGLYEHLVAEHGHAASYKSVVRYVRSRFGRPPLRTYWRVETPLGTQAQSDWGHFPALDIGRGVLLVHAFVMVLSFSRRAAVILSERVDQVSWIDFQNRAVERFGGFHAVNRIDNVEIAMSEGAGALGHAAFGLRGLRAQGGLPHRRLRVAQAIVVGEDRGEGEAPPSRGRREARPLREFRRAAGGQGRATASLQRADAVSGDGKNIAECFLEERPLLKPLPHLPEPFDVAVLRTVARDCTVEFEGRLYAVPIALPVAPSRCSAAPARCRSSVPRRS